MNRVSHELSPYSGFQDPIAMAMRARTAVNAVETLNATFSRFAWSRAGYGSDTEPDPRSNVAESCGWPEHPSGNLLMYLYMNDAVAARVVEFMTKQAWQVMPKVTEDERVEDTPFLDSLWELNRVLRGGDENGYMPKEGHALFADLKLVDIVSGIDSYGVLYLALDDGLDPAKPVAGIVEEGSRPSAEKDAKVAPSFSVNGNGHARQRYGLTRNAEQTEGRKLISTLALPAIQADVVAWETNENSPRKGWPTMYSITDIDPGRTWSGIMPPTRSRNVHWTRCVHLADWSTHAIGGNRALAASRMKVVLPEILDGRKISGANGIAAWLNAQLKIFLESNPSLGGDVMFNKGEAQADFENMMNDPRQQWMFLRGLHANPVAPALADPSPHQKAKIERICIKCGWPVRIFVGSERGELASSQDEIQHKDNVRQHQNDYVSPSVIAPTLNRLASVGVLKRWGDLGYQIDWPEIGSQDPAKKAAVFLTRMQALGAAGQQDYIDDRNVLIKEAGFTEEEADDILATKEEEIVKEEEMLVEQGLKPEAPEGFVDPEQQEMEQEVELEKAKAGGGGVPPQFQKGGAGKKPAFVKNQEWLVKMDAARNHERAQNMTAEELFRRIKRLEQMDAAHNANDFFAECDRDDEGRCTSGGGGGPQLKADGAMHNRLADAIEQSRRPDAAMHGFADAVVEVVIDLPKAELFKTLTKAGLDGVKERDSKVAMIRRLHNRITAATRARERAEV